MISIKSWNWGKIDQKNFFLDKKCFFVFFLSLRCAIVFRKKFWDSYDRYTEENGKSSPLSVNVGYLDLVGQISLLNATFWPCSDMPIEKYEVFFTLEVKKTGLQVFYLILRLSFQLFFQRPAFEEEKVKEKMRSFSGFLFCCWVLLFVLSEASFFQTRQFVPSHGTVEMFFSVKFKKVCFISLKTVFFSWKQNFEETFFLSLNLLQFAEFFFFCCFSAWANMYCF